MENDERRYYVYVYTNPLKEINSSYTIESKKYDFKYEPFYVGCGTKDRYRQHISESKRVQNLIKIIQLIKY